jgi:hypothetical protein
LLFGLAPGADSSGLKSLEEELLAQAPAILRYLEDKGYQHVGVLKFLIQKGRRPARDDIGTLNTELATKLCLALGVREPNKDEKVVLLRDASAVAAQIEGASHTTPEGREKLFTGRYPLVWGAAVSGVTSSAFLTGVATISPDRRTIDVLVQAFDSQGGEPAIIKRFRARIDAEILRGIGEGYIHRGLPVAGADSTAAAEETALESAAQVALRIENHPLLDPVALVALDVFYDGRLVKSEAIEGELRIVEPQEGQKVRLVVRRQGRSRDRLAVVVQVNGENTLYRERKPAFDCAKWIMEPDADRIQIEGFQTDGQTRQDFRILSPAESRQSEVNYGGDVGLITLVVFRERQGEAPTPVLLPQDQQFLADDVAAVKAGAFPEKPAKNVSAFKFQVRDLAKKSRGLATRGLIGEGEAAAHRIRDVTFAAEPVAVLTASLRYYRP